MKLNLFLVVVFLSLIISFWLGPAKDNSHVAPHPQPVHNYRTKVGPPFVPLNAIDRSATESGNPLAQPPLDLDEAREWTRKNFSEALAWLMTAPVSEQRDAVAEIVCSIEASLNPESAVFLAERYASGNTNLLENLVQQWAEQNESAAVAYAAAQTTGDLRDRLLSRVAFARSRQYPIEAAKLVADEIAPGEIQHEAAMSVLHQWASREPNAALAWADSFPDETLRDRALNELKMKFFNKEKDD